MRKGIVFEGEIIRDVADKLSIRKDEVEFIFNMYLDGLHELVETEPHIKVSVPQLGSLIASRRSLLVRSRKLLSTHRKINHEKSEIKSKYVNTQLKINSKRLDKVREEIQSFSSNKSKLNYIDRVKIESFLKFGNRIEQPYYRNNLDFPELEEQQNEYVRKKRDKQNK